MYLTGLLLFLLILSPFVRCEEIQTIEARVDAIFAKRDNTGSPGCAVGVFREGQIIFAKGYGMANLELGIRNTPQNIFDLGSTSKQFTAFAIMLLAKDGKLSLDDDIRKYIPEIPNYGNLITIRNLLHHTSGLRDYCTLLDLAGFQNEDLATKNDALKVISKQKTLNFKPGDEYMYSNSGYFLLSVIVERVSGKLMRNFARERIFVPLGMIHTQYNDKHTRIIPGRATGYSEENEGYGISMSNWEQTGDGAVQTSVEDLFLWDRNFYDAKVGGPDLIAQMLIPGELNNGKNLDYAAGLMHGEFRGLKMVSHGGGWAGYRAELIRFPEQKFSVVCLCNLNSMDPSLLARKVAEVYLEDKMEPEPPGKIDDSNPIISLPLSELTKNTGSYYNSKNDSFWKVSVIEGKLIANGPGYEYTLLPVAPDTFRVEGAPATVTFVTSSSGKRPHLKVKISYEKEPRTFLPVETWTPTRSELEKMAGDYKSDELDSTLTLIHENGALLLKFRLFGETPLPLLPGLKESFIYKNITIVFDNNPKNRVEGFTLGTGRVKNIRFIKIH